MVSAVRKKRKQFTKTIAVTGGKGGVGKSNVALNLSVSLAKLGRKVVLMDADLGLANLDLLLGISAKRTIQDLLEGQCELKDVLIEASQGLQIVPASSGVQRLTQLSPMEHAGLVNVFSQLSGQIDYLIIDTAAGISPSIVSFAAAAQEVLMVVLNEPTSIADCYALLKLLSVKNQVFKFHLVANMVKDIAEGQLLFRKLTKITDRFLDIALEFSGALPLDESVKKSVRRQQPFVDLYPHAKVSVAMNLLARKVDQWPSPDTLRGNLEFFVDQLTQDTAFG